MKRFLRVILLFLLPILCCLCLLEIGMRSVPNNYSRKNNWLNENISDVRIWTFGSSHGLYGINPKYFSKPAFNSAHVSQRLRYDAFIFDKFIDRADSLEWVVLPISYFTLVSRLEDSKENWRIKNYCLYYDCPYHQYNIDYHCEVIGNPKRLIEQVERVGKYWGRIWLKGHKSITIDTLLGFAPEYVKSQRVENWFANGGERAKNSSKDLIQRKPIIDENIRYMDAIICRCAEKDISVLLLTTPVCSSYSSNVDSAQYALMVTTCREFGRRYNNVHYLNLFTDTRFDENDFYDADHLEVGGATKFTKIIDEYLESLSSIN